MVTETFRQLIEICVSLAANDPKAPASQSRKSLVVIVNRQLKPLHKTKNTINNGQRLEQNTT